jgi:hypothetical protein
LISDIHFMFLGSCVRLPLWSSGQSSWIQIQRSGLDSWRYQIFWEVVGLKWGPLSLVSTIEELLGRKSSSSCLEKWDYGRRDSSHWQHGILYPQKLALSLSTIGGRSVGIVCLQTQAMEFSFFRYMCSASSFAILCLYLSFSFGSYTCNLRLPQRSWLQIQRSGFNSRRYQIFLEVVGLEVGPLSLMSTIEELLGRKSSGSSLENRDYECRDPLHWPCGALYTQIVGTNFADKRRSLSRYCSLAGLSHRVQFLRVTFTVLIAGTCMSLSKHLLTFSGQSAPIGALKGTVLVAPKYTDLCTRSFKHR